MLSSPSNVNAFLIYAYQADLAAAIIPLKHSFSMFVLFHFTSSPLSRLSVLDETDIRALLAEALTADVKTVLSNQTSGMCADSAVKFLVS